MMKLVIDANILFAAIINDGISAELIVKNDIYAPQFILDEINKHESTIRKKTNRTYEDMQMFLEWSSGQLDVVRYSNSYTLLN
jgi:predicted nucleic acid-binding protein